MNERNQDSVFQDCREAPNMMSINTRKITDACRDKDCIEDLRVYLTTGSQALMNTATSVRVRCADLIHAIIDVETHAC